jgi:hypothetical protein
MSGEVRKTEAVNTNRGKNYSKLKKIAINKQFLKKMIYF